jgi:hypothetical protein
MIAILPTMKVAVKKMTVKKMTVMTVMTAMTVKKMEATMHH